MKKNVSSVMFVLIIFLTGFAIGNLYTLFVTQQGVFIPQKKAAEEAVSENGIEDSFLDNFYGKIIKIDNSILWVRKVVGPDVETKEIIEVSISPRTELTAMKYQKVEDFSKQFIPSNGNAAELKENMYARIFYSVKNPKDMGERVDAKKIYYSDKNPFLFQ